MSQIALVTGGQQGIGLGIAEALVAAGFRVALASQFAKDTPVVQNALAQLGDAARYFELDLRDIASVPALVDAVGAKMGPITTLVSNAGVPAKVRGDMLDILPENFDFVLNVNLRGAFFLAQEVARRMRGRPVKDYRSITFVTSVSAAMVSVERAEYCISKAGASMMAALFAVRLAPLGIGVYELRPGIIETAMTSGVKDQYTARIGAGLVPAARWGQPADIGQVIVPIATGRMAFANGAVIPVDGGLSIPRL
ncbi:MAG: 3-ketoacyl-ACP reductase [Pseudorhodobacter sp.]|nr:3-ketoacyl-ACP reductase [Pseudorhodobacter sp.]